MLISVIAITALAMDLSTAIWIGVISPVLLIGLGLYLANRWRGREASLSVMTVAFSIVFALLGAAAGLAIYGNQLRIWENCRDSINRSDGNRGFIGDLSHIVAKHIPGPDGDVIVAEIIQARESNLPARDISECGPHP